MAKRREDIENNMVLAFPSQKRYQAPVTDYVQCAGCRRIAKYIVHGQPHCEEHMKEALCGVPTLVSTIDGGFDDAS